MRGLMIATLLAASFLLKCPEDDSMMLFTGQTQIKGSVTWRLYQCSLYRHRYWFRD